MSAYKQNITGLENCHKSSHHTIVFSLPLRALLRGPRSCCFSEDRFYIPPPPPRGGGVQKLLSQVWYCRSLKNHFQEVVVHRISLPNFCEAFSFCFWLASAPQYRKALCLPTGLPCWSAIACQIKIHCHSKRSRKPFFTQHLCQSATLTCGCMRSGNPSAAKALSLSLSFFLYLSIYLSI